MAFYGSIFSNESPWSDARQIRPARHIACPQRLKYIHNIKDGYIPYVEDSAYVSPTTNENLVKKTNRLGLYNAMHDWRQELMGLARQVQSSLVSLNEVQQTRSSQRQYRRANSSMPNHNIEQNNEDTTSKRISNRNQTARYPLPLVAKPRISIDINEQESSNTNENQDPGIWLLPILCHILHVDNINEAQNWLINANITEKRLAMELISRTMQDMQHQDNPFLPDLPTNDQSGTASNLNNLYWPYKFWQRQQQSKFTTDNNETCERATSPVRILTPAKRLSTTINDRSSTASTYNRSSQNLQTSTTPHVPDIWRPSTRLITPMTANSSERLPRRSYRIATTASVSTNKDNKLLPTTHLRGKTPLV